MLIMSLDIEISKDGYKILRVYINDKKRYIGSKYNQKREIDNFINSLGEITQKDNYIILGLSFAEHIENLLKIAYKNSHILIVELNDELRAYCKNDSKINTILNDSRVILAKSNNEIKNFFDKYINESNISKLKVNPYCNYEEIYIKELQNIYKIIKQQATKTVLNRNTGVNMGELSFDNLLNNLKHIAKSTPVNNLKDKYKDKGAIIVSAGPSLSKNIDKLKNVKKGLIFSGGRTLRPLLEKDIMPSLIGITDPGEVSYKLVEGYMADIECPLIFNDEVSCKILDEHNINNFFSSSNKLLDDVWNKKIKSLYSGGSVAHMLITLAIYMGCNPIIFIGQDLAYTGERGHDVSAGNKWRELTFDDYKRKDDIYVEDIYGNPIRTSITLNDYRISMEEIIEKNPNVNFINATEGGANVSGAKNMTLEEALKSLEADNVEKVGNFLVNEDKTNHIIQELKYTLNTFDKYVVLCEKGLLVSKEYKRGYNSKDTKLTRKSECTLNKIDNKIRKNLHSLDIINAALSKMIYTIENNDEFLITLSDDEETSFNKNINKSEALYSGIKEEILKCHEKIEKTIMELGDRKNG